MNPSTAQARVLVDELRRCGITDAVLAPGSRSAPLALALAAEPRIRLHVRIDERSASYLAIGLARASGRPAAVVCTSGTAAAALHPAVLEADLGGVPLLVLTADRPPELRGTGASQTVDQLGLFGRAVRMFAEVGVPEPVVGQVGYWRSLVGRAVAAAGRRPGSPERAVPGAVGTGRRPGLARAVGRPGRRWALGAGSAGAIGAARPGRGPRPAGPRARHGRRRRRGGRSGGRGPPGRGTWVAGAGRAHQPGRPPEGPNAIAAPPLLLGDPWFAAQSAEVVLTVGRPGLSRAVLRWIARCDRQIVVDPSAHWADPTRTAALVLPDIPWLRRGLRRGHRRSPRPVGTAGGAPGVPPPPCWTNWSAPARLTEVGVAGVVGAALPAGGLLICGPSRPIRDVELTLPARGDITVVANRGVNGIDGVVSTAIGAALAHQRRVRRGGWASRCAARRPDLSVRPERPAPRPRGRPPPGPGAWWSSTTTAVASSRRCRRPAWTGFERVFGTPHGIDLCADAATAGVAATTVTTAAELAEAIREPCGFRMVRVPTERTDTAKLHRGLQEAIGVALRP